MRFVRLTVILLLLLVGAVSAQEWHVEIVDNEVYCGDCNSLAIDRDGYPHISYYAKGVVGGNPALRYARWTGSEWDIQIVDSEGNCGAYTSLALDEDDHPCISYLCGEDTDLRYATWTGSEWDIQLVDEYGPGCTFTSLAFDSEWNPHITYTMGTGIVGSLKYAFWTGSEWDIQIVDEDNGYQCCWFTSLVLDSSDYPHIAYFGWTGGDNDLMYAHFDGVEWIIETPDDAETNCGASACITLDSEGNPHISYWASGYRLKYVYWDGWDWQIQTVDTMYMGGYEFGNTSIVLDLSEYPHITYANNDYTPTLRHTYWTGESWVKEVVDDAPTIASGICNSLVLDTDDQPCISYSRYPDSRELVYAWYEEGVGVEDDPEGVDPAGILISSINPNPVNHLASFEIYTESPGMVDVGVFDVSGRRIAIISSEEMAAGTHAYNWMVPQTVRNGVYFVRVNAGGSTVTSRMIIVK